MTCIQIRNCSDFSFTFSISRSAKSYNTNISSLRFFDLILNSLFYKIKSIFIMRNYLILILHLLFFYFDWNTHRSRKINIENGNIFLFNIFFQQICHFIKVLTIGMLFKVLLENLKVFLFENAFVETKLTFHDYFITFF